MTAFSTTYIGALDDEGAISGFFTPPAGSVAYVLVYQGTIGATGSDPLDPVDQGIAIAAKRFIYQPETGVEVTAAEFAGTWQTESPVVAVSDPTTRSTRTKGQYQLTYQSGHAMTHIANMGIGTTCSSEFDQDCLNGNICSETILHTKAYFPYNLSTPPNIEGVPPPPLFEYQVECSNTDCYRDVGEVNAARLQQNTPLTPVGFCHDGGKFGPVAARVRTWGCGGEVFSVVNLTYTVQKKTYRHVNESSAIQTLTIADFQTVAAKLLPCADCGNQSTLPAWNGSMPLYPDYDGTCGFMQWQNDQDTGSSGVAINGFEVLAYVWVANDLPTIEQAGWRFGIWCKTPAGPSKLVWSGYKSRGYTPTGVYVLDQSIPDNGCSTYDLCTITIQ